MTQSEVEYYLNEAASNEATWVSFTGGEPFLYPDLLGNSIGYASSLGLRIEVVTNSYWANSFEDAMQSLIPLKENGLDVLNLSVDDYHQEQIPLENIRNSFRAAEKTGLKTVFMITLKKDSKITAESLKKIFEGKTLLKIGESKAGDPDGLIIESPFIPIGRGENIKEEVYNEGKSSTLCREMLTDIGIKPDGAVMPCCGPLGVLEEASLGNLREESLSSILERAWNNPLFTDIREQKFIDTSNRCVNCLTRFM
jgi:radical SAM protein with 4Fe4S-binding SPASM domain